MNIMAETDCYDELSQLYRHWAKKDTGEFVLSVPSVVRTEYLWSDIIQGRFTIRTSFAISSHLKQAKMPSVGTFSNYIACFTKIFM